MPCVVGKLDVDGGGAVIEDLEGQLGVGEVAESESAEIAAMDDEEEALGKWTCSDDDRAEFKPIWTVGDLKKADFEEITSGREK
jgi:hypothetical protein